MLDSGLRTFGLRSDFDLCVMKPDQDLTYVTNAVVSGMARVLCGVRPDRVLVQGDTTTSFAAALAAFYSQTPVGHVEAGLRSGIPSMPWPEEMNRRLTDVLSDRHYVPTERARKNLLAEGVAAEGIAVTGNTVVDALEFIVERLRCEPELVDRICEDLPSLSTDKRLILVTGHRRENIGEGLANVCDALKQVSARNDVEIVCPVHPNPRVRNAVHAALGAHRNIHLVPPLDYASFVYLMTRSSIVLTDSGGVQEEAPSLGKPVLVTRDVTERPEAVEAGTVKLVGTNADRIVDEVTTLLDDPLSYAAMARVHNPYGDGRASERIVADLIRG